MKFEQYFIELLSKPLTRASRPLESRLVRILDRGWAPAWIRSLAPQKVGVQASLFYVILLGLKSFHFRMRKALMLSELNQTD